MNCRIPASIFCLLLATQPVAGGGVGEKVTKEITREFIVSPDDTLELTNQYGNINITIGEANRVLVDIVITASSSTQKQASDIIDKISFDFTEDNSMLTISTHIDPAKKLEALLKTNSSEIDIDYQISVPADIFLALKNFHGNIFVANTERKITVNLEHGILELGDVNADVDLNLSHSTGRISQIYNGRIDLMHSALEMEDGRDLSMNLHHAVVASGTLHQLNLTSSFSKLNSNSVGILEYHGRHDTLVIQSANSVSATASYSVILLDQLNEKGTFEMKHGHLSLHQIQRNFSAIFVNASFTNVEIGFTPDASFSLDAKANYGNISQKGLKVINNIEKSNRQKLLASRGSSGGKVIVQLNYGDLKIL